MTKKQYIDNVKLELTGDLIHLEIPDETLEKLLDRTLQEVQRFIDTTQLMTVPYASCIDLSNTEVSSVTKVYRVEGYTGDTETATHESIMDPMYVQTWMAFTNGGTMYNLNDYVLNFASYNTMLQIRNTTSTDMAFRQDHQAGKLYINSGFDKPYAITIEYVPVFNSVEDVKSDYWIDIIQRLFLARTKVILGRIRTRYKQNNALWEQDGETLLAEGQEELKDLQEKLRVNSQIVYPID